MIDRNVISTWSSGTGGAGIIGALSYASLTSIGISPVNTMLIMLSVPVLEALVFWILLRSPSDTSIDHVSDSRATSITASTVEIKDVQTAVEITKNNLDDEDKPLTTFASKLRYVPSLFKYMVPLALVYLLEYFINQGLVSCVCLS